jgi:hypothetical protein
MRRGSRAQRALDVERPTSWCSGLRPAQPKPATCSRRSPIRTSRGKSCRLLRATRWWSAPCRSAPRNSALLYYRRSSCPSATKACAKASQRSCPRSHRARSWTWLKPFAKVGSSFGTNRKSTRVHSSCAAPRRSCASAIRLGESFHLLILRLRAAAASTLSRMQ